MVNMFSTFFGILALGGFVKNCLCLHRIEIDENTGFISKYLTLRMA